MSSKGGFKSENEKHIGGGRGLQGSEDQERDVRGSIDEAVESVAKGVRKAKEQADDLEGAAKARVGNALEAGKDQLQDYADMGRQALATASERTSGLMAELEASARRNPLGAMMVALGLGLILGIGTRRRS